MAKNPRSAAKQKSDMAYNARRRYQRAAKRYLKQAEKTTGETRVQYEELARQATMSAVQTYDPKTRQKFSKPIKELTQRFGIDLETRRDEFITPDFEVLRLRSITASDKFNFSYYEDEQTRKNEEARAVLRSDVGSRIMGGLVDVWKGEKTPETREQALKDYFGVENISEVLEKIEEKIGADLYKELDQDQKYDEIKLTLQSKVNRNELVD